MKKTILTFVIGLFVVGQLMAQFSSDARNQWIGEYRGTCDWSINGKKKTNKNFKLFIKADRNEYKCSCGFGSSSYYIDNYLKLPDNYSSIPKLKITSTSIIQEPSAQYPTKVVIKKETGPFGDAIIKGEIIYYRLTADGNAVESIVVHKFSAGKK